MSKTDVEQDYEENVFRLEGDSFDPSCGELIIEMGAYLSFYCPMKEKHEGDCAFVMSFADGASITYGRRRKENDDI